jgi:hypothetical protein
METEVYKKIIGHEKLIEIFGHWPSFHDAEIITISLNRSGEDKGAGPAALIKIHVFQMSPEKRNDEKEFVCHCHTVVTFRFANIKNLELWDFNNQNVIFSMNISGKQDAERKTHVFNVHFASSYGAGCSFECNSIEIVDLEKGMPSTSP